MRRTYGLAVLLITVTSGIIKQLVLSRGHDASYFLAAVSSSLMLAMLVAVILAVLWERPWQAPVFVCLTATVSALFFYRPELTGGYQALAANLVMVVAFTVLVLANLGCYLRRRLRAMD